MSSDRPLVLACDFDDVVHNPQDVLEGYKMGQPIKDAVKSLQKLKNNGAIIIIFSVWADTNQKREAMSKWLRYFEVPYDSITNIKGNSDFYIDNKAIHFQSWEQTLEEITLRRPETESRAS